jgi:Cys-tRNA(Pro)/Cys-tRNA(Cys) deacylase
VARRKAEGASTPATLALIELGIAFTPRPYQHDPSTLEAAAALGVDPSRVFKTLMAEVDGSLVVAVVPVSGQLDLKALATAVGGKRARLADPAVAERKTGYVVGGISPIGQRASLPTVLDASATDHETVFVSGGRRGFDLELAPEGLRTAASAVWAPIAR